MTSAGNGVIITGRVGQSLYVAGHRHRHPNCILLYREFHGIRFLRRRFVGTDVCPIALLCEPLMRADAAYGAERMN